MCSLIVHLHLNRLSVLYPVTPETVRNEPSLCIEFFKYLIEAVINIERGFKIDLVIYKAFINFNRRIICCFTEARCIFTDSIAVKIYGGHTLHITFVGNLISFIIETIAYTAVGFSDFSALDSRHITKYA